MMFHETPSVDSLSELKLASTARLTVLYRRLYFKDKHFASHIWFNSVCKKNKVFPNYISIKTRNSSKQAKRAVEKAKFIWLRLEISKWYSRRDNIRMYLKLIHSELTRRLHRIEFEWLDNKIREDCSIRSEHWYRKKQRKINKLLSAENTTSLNDKQPQTSQVNTEDIGVDSRDDTYTFYPRFVNLSDTIFTTEETTLLNKGMKYSPKSSVYKKDYVNLALDLDVALKSETNTIKHICVDIISKNNANKQNNTASDTRVIKNIRQKIADNALVISKADKGNSLICIKRSDYNNKVLDFIEQSDTTELAQDPTNGFKNKVKSCLKACKNIFDSKSTYKYINMNTSAPILYGLIKIHKEGNPIRPVSSFVNAPTYKLCREFNRVFVEKTNFTSKYAIKNSLELTQKIKDLFVPQKAILVSFDVKNLFPSIPLIELKDIINTLIDTQVKDNTIKTELKIITNVCLNQNYCRFNDKFYKFNDGLTMGSPSSPLFAEVYMNNFENKLFNSCPFKHLIQFWYRYVDDIICLWLGNETELDNFLEWLNSINDKIQFSIEIENEKTLNFLDLSIKHHTNYFEFGIFRKPTFTDVIVPANSRHPIQTKISAFHSLVSRLVNIPLSKDAFQKEKSLIKEIAKNNGYNPDIVDKLIVKKTKQIINKLLYPIIIEKENKKWVKLNYVGKASYKIEKILKQKCNAHIGFYNNKTIKDLLVNNKNKIDKLQKSGVYEIKCKDCESVYIGQTGRSFKLRFKEHIAATKYNYTNSSIAKHLINYNHECDIKDLKILDIENKGRKLDVLEACRIKEAQKKGKLLLNDQLELITSPFTDFIIRNLS